MQKTFEVKLKTNETYELQYGYVRQEQGKMGDEENYRNQCRIGLTNLNLFIMFSVHLLSLVLICA